MPKKSGTQLADWKGKIDSEKEIVDDIPTSEKLSKLNTLAYIAPPPPLVCMAPSFLESKEIYITPSTLRPMICNVNSTCTCFHEILSMCKTKFHKKVEV